MHKKNFVSTGLSLDMATKALIMVHGRGGSGNDIIGLVEYLDVVDFAVLAPEANANSWYPYFPFPTLFQRTLAKFSFSHAERDRAGFNFERI